MVTVNPRKKQTVVRKKSFDPDSIPGIHFATEEEGRELFDYQARKLLGISGEEFLERFDSGYYKGVKDLDVAHKYNRMVMMMPFVRRVSS